LVAGGLFLLGFLSEIRGGLNGDTAWLLYVSGRVFEGSRLYVDVVEVNPPLIIWLGVPVVHLAHALGWSEIATCRGVLWVVIAGSIGLTAYLLRLALDRDDDYRQIGFLLGAVVVLVTIPGPYFGQREHLALALLLPWIISGGARVSGRNLGAALSVSVGALAAIGIALKPHYLVVAAGMVGFLYGMAPRGRRALLPETVLFGLVTVYTATVLVAAPEYLALLTKLGGVYWDYLRRPLDIMLLHGLIPLTVVGSLLLWPLTRRLTRYSVLADLLGISTLGLLGAVVLQHKGFWYHYYPALGTGLLALLLGLLGGASPAAPWLRVTSRSLAALVALPCVALLLVIALARAGGSFARRPVAAGAREIGAFLRVHPPTGTIVVFSPWMEDSFPLVLETGVHWGSRYPFMWFMAALHRSDLKAGSSEIACHNPSTNPAVEHALVGSVSDDLRMHRPQYVFVRKPGTVDLLRLNLLACFLRDAAFRQEFAAYSPTRALEHFVVFERAATGERP
jgi:hypothetical protein